jgi:uncharacterized protein
LFSQNQKVKKLNLLAQETSPYLLQHANNPIYWNAWKPETLAKAKENNQLIILSVGYSACHWCHVMEHESFEDAQVAAVMNRNFISIKVDREERPDIDAVYMKAVQIMTNQGGWPLNVVCLPDGRPVWGGTYFRKEEWMNALEQLANLYATQPEKMEQYAIQLQNGLSAISLIENVKNDNQISQEILKPLVEKWKRSFDLEFGGMARAPKFMMPNNYQFLMRYAHQNKDTELMEFVNLSLTKMAYGGLFDTVDGGFSRYSVDMKWHVPHFEKMLYDNAQMVSLYANAHKLTKNNLYKTVVEKTMQFVEKEWFTEYNGFYSALDADSLNAENKLEEGVFFVWTKAELQKILKNDFALFSQVFNINDFGFWEHNNYVLIQNESLENIAKNNNISVDFLEEKKIFWETTLYKIREKRHKPRLDDKCLTSWNAMMAKACLDAYAAFGVDKYLEMGLKNTNFIVEKVWSVAGNLFHSFKDGKATINGFLEDYAAVIELFIRVYQVSLDENWLHKSKQLTDYCLDHFYDEKSGFFSFKSNLDEALIVPHFEVEDNVISASNSVMGHNLYLLGIYFENAHYEAICQRMLQYIVAEVDYPSAYSNWLQLFMNNDQSQKELAICGEKATEYIKKTNAQYLPNVVLAGCEKVSDLPFLKNRFVENETLFYVCEQKSCKQPTADFEELASLFF